MNEGTSDDLGLVELHGRIGCGLDTGCLLDLILDEGILEAVTVGLANGASDVNVSDGESILGTWDVLLVLVSMDGSLVSSRLSTDDGLSLGAWECSLFARFLVWSQI